LSAPVIIIGGPTASGKSGLALEVAGMRGGVVVNADSMQLYDGLPLLTAQPSAADKEKIPHALYGVLRPDDACSAPRWRDLALKEIEKIHADGKIPIVTGGTGFYLKTLLKGISPMPDIPPEFREKAAALQKEMGNPAFHADLEKRDPAMAARLDPYNTQRLVRAREVLEATGKSLAHWQDAPADPPPQHLRFITVTLLPPRETLHRQCDSRFDEIMKAGALPEAAGFLKQQAAGKISASAPLMKALGLPELAAHLAGRDSLPVAVDKAKQATRRYAKRQTTWFRHQIAADIALQAPDARKIAEYL